MFRRLSTSIRSFVRWASVIALLVLISYFARMELGPRREGEQRLAEVIAELDTSDPGWRWEAIEAARQVVPEAENSGPRIQAVSRQLPKDFMTREVFERIKQLPTQQLPERELWDNFVGQLNALQPAIEDARKLIQFPRGRFEITVAENPLATPLDHAQDARATSFLLYYDACRMAYDRNGDGAIRSLRAGLNVAAALRDEPTLISQLVRLAILRMCLRTTARVLAHSEPTAEALESMQAALLAWELEHPFRVGVRGERAMAHLLMDRVAAGRVGVARVADNDTPENQKPRQRFVEWFYRRYYSSGDHADVLSLMTEEYKATFEPTEDQSALLQAINQHALHIRSYERLFVGLLVPGKERVFHSDLDCRAETRCTAAILAAERFRRETGHLPDSVKDLVPKYLPAEPTDPYTGTPLISRRESDHFIVYSVGRDLEDNGGDFSHESLIGRMDTK